MIETYRKKPVSIQAIQLFDTKESVVEAIQFVFDEDLDDLNLDMMYEIVSTVNKGLIIPTLEGDMKAEFSDYIIKGVKGEHYPVKEEIFNLTYDKVED